jgi:protein-disulfide isomerase
MTQEYKHMRNKLTAGALALALTASTVLVPASVHAEETFSRTQTNELHNIIREYLLENPEILNQMITKLQTAEREQQEKSAKAAITSNADTLFRNGQDVVVGNPNGNVTMVEFFDYNCGYCKRSVADVLRLTEEDKNLRVVMKEFPILSEGSTIASRAALASKKQGKYWEFHLALMGASGSIDSEAKVMAIATETGLDIARLKADMDTDAASIDKHLDETRALAQALGINGTPAFVIDENLVPGALPYEQLAASVKSVRDSGGCKAC